MLGEVASGGARRGYLRNGLRWFDSIGAGCGLAWQGEVRQGAAWQGEDTYGWSHRRFDSADVGCGDAWRGSVRLGTVWRGKVIHAKALRRFDSVGVNRGGAGPGYVGPGVDRLGSARQGYPRNSEDGGATPSAWATVGLCEARLGIAWFGPATRGHPADWKHGGSIPPTRAVRAGRNSVGLGSAVQGAARRGSLNRDG